MSVSSDVRNDAAAKKAWRKPAIIVSETADETHKISYPHDTTGSICTAVCHPTAFGS